VAAPVWIIDREPLPTIAVAPWTARERLARILADERLDTVLDSGSADVLVSVHHHAGRNEVEALKADVGTRKLVLVVDEISARVVHEAFDAGADAVVAAVDAESTLVPAIRAAWAGLASFPAAVRERFAQPPLSPREKQVLGLVVMGFTNAEISSKLHIAETTVKTHLASIFGKLGVRSRSEATSLVLDPVRGQGLGVLAITRSAD
jgi:DNA-binding NarL/FixJ family response regulator